MKKWLLLNLLVLLNMASHAQMVNDDNYNLNFDDTLGFHHLRVDTLSNPDNIWQIGHPQKSNFTNAFSPPNVIVTDTVNPYPVNDTSSFILTNVANGGGFEYQHTVTLEGYYNVNSDTLTDYGKIEVSFDMGYYWIELTDLYSMFWYSEIPVLSGNSFGWKYFKVNVASLPAVYGYPTHDGDTVLYRFTFISDSLQTNKDGLMFDHLTFIDYWEGIDEFENDPLISVFPNPVSDHLTINEKINNDHAMIRIFDSKGQTVYYDPDVQKKTIDAGQFNNGLYLLKYTTAKGHSIKKFEVRH